MEPLKRTIKLEFENNGQGWERADGFKLEEKSEGWARFEEILKKLPYITKEDFDFCVESGFIIIESNKLEQEPDGGYIKNILQK